MRKMVGVITLCMMLVLASCGNNINVPSGSYISGEYKRQMGSSMSNGYDRIIFFDDGTCFVHSVTSGRNDDGHSATYSYDKDMGLIMVSSSSSSALLLYISDDQLTVSTSDYSLGRSPK